MRTSHIITSCIISNAFWTGHASFVQIGIGSDAVRVRTTKTIDGLPRTPTFICSDPSDDNQGNRFSQSQEEFLEVEAQAGAEKVRQMSIEERTKRAMLAEAAEDRMISLSDELDALLGEDGMPLKVEYRDEIVSLAKEIKSMQERYRALVNGEPDVVLSLSLDGGLDADDIFE
jgi:hypothetical protein